jgi:3-hydroxypropanoate dehydrogenase
MTTPTTRPRLDDAALDAIFRTARSYNGYLDQPVSDDELKAVWELMKWGPTSANQLPARLVWVRTPEGKEKLAACCSEANAPKILKAPATVIVGMDTEFHEQLPWLFPHTDAKSWFDGNAELRQASAFRNSTLQGAYLMIAARALGLDVGAMSGFDAGSVDKAFFADTPSVHANFIATIGHGDPASIHDRLPRPDFETFNTLA